MGKWMVAIAALFAAVLTAAVILTVTGVIQPQEKVIEYAKKVDWLRPHAAIYAIGRSADEWRQEEQRKLDKAWQEVEEQLVKITQERSSLQQQAAELEKQLSQLEATRQQLAEEQRILQEIRQEQENVLRLAEMYSEMRAQDAAAIIESLEMDLAVRVVLEMNPRQASEVLAALPVEVAASLSRKIREGSR